ncbi:hypothetical protein BD410DRAFT_782135 [Rickenella mellea]|uniref:Arrestin C-terminal-like domain-containing protein n=1 Tax=Rickenella mellea TaxID=50990 RepID=A0A4Y7QMT9_9AGAM|nr:hypothetical protein BD410DRAFT_782135 [Rickenella mellea]
MSLHHSRKRLEIRLSESFVFLRGSVQGTVFGRPQEDVSQPAILRGLLVFTVDKPMKVSSIEVQIVGKSVAMGSDGFEAYKVLSASNTFFRAARSSPMLQRSMSVGSGSAFEGDGQEHANGPALQDQTNIPRRRVSLDHNDLPLLSVEPPASGEIPTAVLHGMDSNGTQSISPTQPAETPSRTHIPPIIAQGVLSNDNFRPSLSGPSPSSNSRSSTFPPTSNDNRDATLGTSTSPQPLRSTQGLSESSLTTTSGNNSSSDESRGRSRQTSRLSLLNVSHAFLHALTDHALFHSTSHRSKVAVKANAPEHSQERDANSIHHDHAQSRPKDDGSSQLPAHDRPSEEETKASLNGSLSSCGDGWVEFRKGTYTYPISFAIPNNSPPTLHCDYGSVRYMLKATVHRPGALSSKLTAYQEVTLIAAPPDGVFQGTDNIIVQRHWGNQMQYEIVISGKMFPIGSIIRVNLSILPMDDIKIYKIAFALEENVKYMTRLRDLVHAESPRRFELMELKYIGKDAPPILPLTSDYASSPLRGMIEFDSSIPKDEEDEVATSILKGTGPWTLRHNLQLPTSCGQMHFTNRHAMSNIIITHFLKIKIRMEHGDRTLRDPRTGKGPLFEITVTTPVYILSCQCKPEWISLPRYSFAENEDTKRHSCLCDVKRQRGTPSDFSSLFDHAQAHRDHLPSKHHHTLDILHTFAEEDPVADTSIESVEVTHTPMPELSDVDSLYERTKQFEMLMEGRETERGEFPPDYER